jgi:N-methylhydantoinase A
MQEYLATLESDLRAAGCTGHLFIATSFGGAWRPAQVVERPIYSVGSGPSMAPVAALTYGREELPDEAGELLVCDTGGTTFDVGLVSGGEVHFTNETWIGGRWIGHITGIRAVDVKSIGAGGGSIVWIDPGGLLRVGPGSAGADPGPACYGRGGAEPTVTDAAVVLGYIDPGFFLGGRLTLDADAARRAVAAIAERMGMTVEEAAAAALTIASENIVGAIREITIARGIDPREVTIVAGGGASGLNIVPIARELGCRRVLLPSTAGALSACGALYSDVVSEVSTSRYLQTRSDDVATVNAQLADVDALAGEFLASLDDVAPRSVRTDFFVEARYPGQVWELDVPIPQRRLESADDLRGVEEAFHQVHERVFAVREPGQYLECLIWKARATAELEKPQVRARSASATREADAAPAYFRELGTVEVVRHDGPSLQAGTRIEGPAIVREPTTTVVVYPGSAATVTELGNYLLEIELPSPSDSLLRGREEVVA